MTARGRHFIGCSGWSYADWRGKVYPSDAKAGQWFGLYAQRFGTVEINNWFYRLPTEALVDSWAAQAPDGFVFAVKLGQFGSHRKKLRDAVTWLPNHLARAERLGSHLGPTLVQLPPRWRRDTGRLDEFLHVAPKSMRWAVEIRDPSWFHDDVFELLRAHGAALCLHDMLPDHPWMLTTDWTYLRFHGPAAETNRYWGRYGGRRLWRYADRILDWNASGIDAYAYFNNDYNGDAVQDATWLETRLNREAAAA